MIKGKPFVKWAGGKRQIIDKLKQYVPHEFNTYYEPFVGGGALLFELSPKKAVINDYNKELMNVYVCIKDSKKFEAMCRELNHHETEHSEEYYYEILNWISKTNRQITWVLEGQHIYRFLKLQDIKGKLIVKRTSLINCWIRSIVRHIKKGKIELRGNQITKKQYCANNWYWIKRRTKQLKYAKVLNQFVKEVMKGEEKSNG